MTTVCRSCYFLENLLKNIDAVLEICEVLGTAFFSLPIAPVEETGTLEYKVGTFSCLLTLLLVIAFTESFASLRASEAEKSPRIASKACICSEVASWYLLTKLDNSSKSCFCLVVSKLQQ